jgi:hypothetical protein
MSAIVVSKDKLEEPFVAPFVITLVLANPL